MRAYLTVDCGLRVDGEHVAWWVWVLLLIR